LCSGDCQWRFTGKAIEGIYSASFVVYGLINVHFTYRFFITHMQGVIKSRAVIMEILLHGGVHKTRLTMCVQRTIVAVSPNSYRYGNPTALLFTRIVVEMHVDVNNIQVFIVETETQEWMSFALLSTHRICPTVANNENVL
jgi:hypothetical protein